MGANTNLSRRAFLASASAAAVVAGLPAGASVPVAPVAAASKPLLPAWIVGTPGEPDHEIIRATTREAAIRFRAEECEFSDEPDEEEGLGGPDCECCACFERNGYEATRVEAWDARPTASIKDVDWLKAGFDATCVRCGYEASQDDGSRAVGEQVVCYECLTLADWDAIDPEHAAELRAEMDETSHPEPSR